MNCLRMMIPPPRYFQGKAIKKCQFENKERACLNLSMFMFTVQQSFITPKGEFLFSLFLSLGQCFRHLLK